jgi:1-deoxy-D-xylulose 5-phosphate reductoisomerase
MRGVTILGATGSIGTSALDVIARHPDRYRVHALTAQSSVDALADLAAAIQAVGGGHRRGSPRWSAARCAASARSVAGDDGRAQWDGTR